ncbi:GNAT family N-acetyltransferase [Nocardia fluminea]|uniref:GNAT family N-acetyltransferase n=1 Tax=Nocardia fluminea TaxID=134984 RepID=UPI003D0D1B59
MHRFDAYTHPDRATGFDLVIVTLGDIAIGQTWGWPLPPGTAWWTGLELDDAALDHDEFTRETGKRTFALSEIMVDQTRTGHGIAHALHDEILSQRLEERATLLVDPENPRAYSAYREWGWSRVGTLTPTWDGAPAFDVLIRSHSRYDAPGSRGARRGAYDSPGDYNAASSTVPRERQHHAER